MKKRKTAADVFQEQNIMYQGQLEEEEVQAASPAPQQASRLAAAPSMKALAPSPTPPPKSQMQLGGGLMTSEELQLEKEPIPVRETGFGIWKRIIVPPNAYVVHTRMRRKEPVTLGLGVSFRYNPYTDAYLVVPAAMQTIGVVANCISKEKQGLNILAYVQWQIDDFSVAYQRLDFSDSRDPLGIVNAQLREQAEAAIKDKIATMSIEEVLTDKALIIEELTTRLKAVAEGRNQAEESVGDGLGIKIVTVQIRESLVSSERLWQHLQAPYRHEQEKTAQLSRLAMQDEIRQKELETRQATETREAETMVAIERIKQSKQTEAQEIKLNEESTRFTREQESAREKIQLEEQTTVAERESEQRLHSQATQLEQNRKLAQIQMEQEATLEQAVLDTETENRQKSLEIEGALHHLAEDSRLDELRVEAEQQRLERETTLKEKQGEFDRLLQEQADVLQALTQEGELGRQRRERLTQLELEEESHRVKVAAQERELEIDRLRQEIRNLMNERDLLSQFINKLPELAAEMPEVHELRVLQTGGDDAGFDAFSSFIAKMLALAESMGIALPTSAPEGDK